MKVASFNVNSIRVRMEIVLEWLKKESPDVLCVQETKVVDDDFPLQPFRDIGYQVIFSGEKKYNGVAIISRHPFEDVRFGFDGMGGYETRMITATINEVPVVNTYIPQGFDPLSEKFREKLDWFQRLYDYFDSTFNPDKPLLWMGDFNVAPEPVDVYDPEKLAGKTGFHPDEQAALQRFREWGFSDVFRMHEPGPEQYTFRDYRIPNAAKRKLDSRIEHIWGTKPLAEKSVRAWIDMEPRFKERPSDHTPVAAEFRL
jgi:exodeoxyribonuclease-3